MSHLAWRNDGCTVRSSLSGSEASVFLSKANLHSCPPTIGTVENLYLRTYSPKRHQIYTQHQHSNNGASNLSMRYIVYEIVSCTYSKNNLKSGVRSSVSEPMFFMVEPCESYQLWENLNSFWKIDVGWQLKILLLFVPCLMRNLH